MPELADAEARNRIRTDLSHSFVVEAAAGTGKTTQLVERVTTLVQSGTTQLSRLVALTFTEKAAGEMKLRLRAELERRRQSADLPREERDNLRTALAELEAAHIATIHAFCADLLRERPIEASVDPDFQVIDAEASQAHLEQAFAIWFDQQLEAPPEGLRRVLRRRPWKAGESPRDVVMSALSGLVEHRDFAGLWRRPELDRGGELVKLLEQLRSLASVGHGAYQPNAYVVRGLLELDARLERVAPRNAKEPPDLDAVEALFAELPRASLPGGHTPIWAYRGGNGDIAPGHSMTDFRAQRTALLEALARVNQLLDADLAACLQRDLAPVVAAYVQRLNAAGALDFLDLLRAVRDLLLGNADVRRELNQRYTHLFVDEFQDTDPLQAEILLLLASDDPEQVKLDAIRPVPGKLFVVGDPKQAIYRFRRADILLYERVKAQLLAAGAELLHLSTSFRSTPAIQALVNQCFSAQMTGGGAQAEYVPLNAYRAESNTQPSVVVLPVPTPYPNWAKEPSPTLSQVAQSFPDAVGGFIDWVVSSSGWQVDTAAGPRPVAARDICCLFRRFQTSYADVTRPYVRALEARRLPHVLVGGRSFHGREEVMALRTALVAIEWPDDELSVYATLRGAFFALSDSELLEFKHFAGQPAQAAVSGGVVSAAPATGRLGKLHPLRPLQLDRVPQSIHAVADALDLLGKLHVGRNRRPIAETITRLLSATRAHAGVAIWPTGEQALANVLALVDQARRYESRGGLSFRGFVDWLEVGAERGTGSDAPVVEEGTDGVRLMTIHGAKGLEFPVVILCDPGAPLKTNRPSRLIDPGRNVWAQSLCGLTPHDLQLHGAEICAQDDAEVVRLGYVAATRARDVLVIPGIGDGPFPEAERWTQLFHAAIYPARGARRAATRAIGCPEFGEDTASPRPFDASSLNPVKPGWHAALASGAGAVWWDPNQLELSRQAPGGVRQHEILSADGDASEARARHLCWRDRLDAQRAAGSVAAYCVHSVTQVAHALSEPVDAAPGPGEAARTRPALPEWLMPLLAKVRIEAPLNRSSSRPRGARFGALVHALLERAPHDDPSAVAELARLLGRQLGSPEAEQLAAREACLNASQHPLMQRARAADEVRRECSLSYRTPAGELWDGVVDLAFREEQRWTVVDFKSDVIDSAPDSYLAQVAVYCHALGLATGCACEAVLLGV